ncbi:MAG: hypothetical protein FJW69_08915 [Actinobacteria bacterium]|nr:hypothetical protein [Actinomycetota bacterium]
MPVPKFESRFLKANENVRDGDIITFLNAGEYREKRLILTVRVERTREEKLFSLNKTNYENTKALYGENTDDWVGKKMKVRIVLVSGPQGETPGIRLYDPAMTKEELEKLGETAGEELEEENPLL